MSSAETESSGSSWSITKLVGSLSVSVLGVNFLNNPEGFVVASLLKWFVGTSTALAGEVGLVASDMFGILSSALADAGAAAGVPFDLAGGIVLDVIGDVSQLAESLAVGAGPFGFIVVLLVWGVTAVAVVAFLTGAFRAYRLIRGVLV